MKYLKVVLEPIRLKGDPDDVSTLQADLYEKITAQIEAETLAWNIDDEEDDSDEDY